MAQWANSRQFLELLAWEAVKFCVAWLLCRVIRHRRTLLFGSFPTSTKMKRIVRSTNGSNSPTSKINVERSNESSLCFLWSSSPQFVLYTCMHGTLVPQQHSRHDHHIIISRYGSMTSQAKGSLVGRVP